MATFQSDLAVHRDQARLEKDSSYASSVGAMGTPTFFIDGRQIVGAQPFDAFETVVAEELTAANRLLSGGTPRSELYDVLTRENAENHPPAPVAKSPSAEDTTTRHHIDEGRSPVLGPASAPVTLVEYGDFQCPFCGRAEATLHRIHEVYRSRVRFVWKNQPLPFHVNALPAAKAAMAAARQGQFWPMHDRIYENQRDLSEASYRRWATELGLDVERFDADRQSLEIAAAIQADQKEGNELGANGTPTFYINGRKLMGAKPFEKFQTLIDGELNAPTVIAK